MPVEIRELRIKTDISSPSDKETRALNNQDLKQLKRHVMNEYKRSLVSVKPNSNFNR